MKTIIAGSRNFNDMNQLEDAISRLDWEITVVVSGKARGADRLGEKWAKENNTPVDPYPAEWNNIDTPDAVIKTNRYGKKYNAKAGYNRNNRMSEIAEACLVMWDGKSKGSKHMLDTARKKGLKWAVWRTDKQILQKSKKNDQIQ